jgi:glycosyltransferase 2 family protein
VGFGGVLAIAVLPWLEPVIHKLIGALPVPLKIRETVSQLIGDVVHGIRSVHDPKRIAGFLSLTCVIWCIDAAGAVFIAHALGLTLTIALAFLLIAGLGLGSALRSTPGYVGIYQFVAVKILTPAARATRSLTSCCYKRRATPS